MSKTFNTIRVIIEWHGVDSEGCGEVRNGKGHPGSGEVFQPGKKAFGKADNAGEVLGKSLLDMYVQTFSGAGQVYL